MGGRRLSREKVAALGFALLAVSAVFFAACGSGSASTPTATPVSPSPSASPTSSPTSSPTPSPTPDPLAIPPRTPEEARKGIADALQAEAPERCPTALVRKWQVRCASGGLDGDDKPDTAYLVPLAPAATTSLYPAAVFVLRSSSQVLEPMQSQADPDASQIGRGFFGIEDRTGDGRGEVSFLATACTSTGCSSFAQVVRWDGTAWRDVGPVTSGVVNLDRIAFRGEGADTVLVTHGGVINAPGAGPTRAESVTYTVQGGRFQVRSRTFDAPVYLYHAIRDADALFDGGDFAGAIAAYRAAIEDKSLKDWQQESRGTPGRPALESYAMLRIAIAQAASGQNPDAVIDQLISEGKDQLFVYAAQKFRQGLNDTQQIHTACVGVTTYLSLVSEDADHPAHLRAVFDYGYANLPAKGYRDICPL